jgi:hydroxypyruvate reductase
VPDENTFRGTQAALDLVTGLKAEDTVLFLLSGGGSALFEKPLIPAFELQDITRQLLACGADITEINTIRKRLSAVKGGRFAQFVSPARVEAVILSDVLGDPPDMIASGPACADPSTAEDAHRIVTKYGLRMSGAARALLDVETPKTLDNVHLAINGSVRELCAAAAKTCAALGYTPVLLTDRLCCQAREAGSFLASVLKTHADGDRSLAFIAGGETVVKVIGTGLGGRNQELALAAAAGISGMPNAAVFSVGSDGTDGPTDAAGGYADGDTANELAAYGLTVDGALNENDAYHALEKTGGLIITGPTGTNVNDFAVALLHI